MIFGYLDPVTGSALIQVALGAMAAIGLGWQYVRKGTRTLFARFKREPLTSSSVAAPELADTER